MAKNAIEEGEKQREKQREREKRGSASAGIGGRSVRGPRGDGGAALAAMWRERGSRMALIIASQFIEMKVRVPLILLLVVLTPRSYLLLRCTIFAGHQEFTAATRLLAPLCTQSSPELRSAVGRIFLQAGLLDQALTEFNLVSESIANTATPSVSAVPSPYTSPNLSRVGSQVSVVSGFQGQSQSQAGSGSGGRGGGVIQRHKNLVNMNAALMASAQGDWVRAEEILRGLVEINPDDFVVSGLFSSLLVISLRSGGLIRPLIFVPLHPGVALVWGRGSTTPNASFRSEAPTAPDRHHPADGKDHQR